MGIFRLEAVCFFQTASLTLQASHPSTPPIPLTRKITLGSRAAPLSSASAASVLKSGSEGSLNSENEENESPAEEERGEEGDEEVRTQFQLR